MQVTERWKGTTSLQQGSFESGVHFSHWSFVSPYKDGLKVQEQCTHLLLYINLVTALSKHRAVSRSVGPSAWTLFPSEDASGWNVTDAAVLLSKQDILDCHPLAPNSAGGSPKSSEDASSVPQWLGFWCRLQRCKARARTHRCDL